LLTAAASISYGQGVWTGWQGNGQQSCYFVLSSCWTPWSIGTASCLPPNIGPDGFRIVGGSIRESAFCGTGSNATADIENNLPDSLYINWTGISYKQGFGTSAEYYAESDCSTTTDGTGDYAGAYVLSENYYGC
jgi:hypothetical protein